jgi:dolichol-phosphate mannosyltransferase
MSSTGECGLTPGFKMSITEENNNNICVVLPTYNEAENIESIIEGVFLNQTKLYKYLINVLVVDDNSPDGTQEKVSSLMKHNARIFLLSGQKIGLGDAYKRGFKFAIDNLGPELIIQMDSDGQHDPSIIPDLVSLIRQGNDVVIGSRFIKGGETPDFNLYRKLISLIGNTLIRIAGNILKIRDCTSGFRCIKVEYIKKCKLGMFSTRGYSFQSLLLYELNKNQAKIVEYPIRFSPRKKGVSKLTIIDQLEFLFNLIKIIIYDKQEFLKYCCVGLIGAIINIICYLLLSRNNILTSDVAALASMEIAILSNFVLNNLWTFTKRDANFPLKTKFVLFHVVAAINGIIFYYLLFLFLESILGIYDIYAIVISILSGTISNYLFSSFWVWRKA